MKLLERLKKSKKGEKDGRVVNRLCMLILFLNLGGTFSETGRKHGCDRRTVSKWWRRLKATRKTPRGIRDALSDRPRTGRRPKIDRGLLEEARKWCEGRAFEIPELSDKLFELSGVRLSKSQVRVYARRWGHRRKKTEPIEIKRASAGAVRVWRHRLFKTIEKFEKLGYTIVTMDEAHFRDAVMSLRYWSMIGMRIFMQWSGNHKRFTMMYSMTSTGKPFFHYCDTANTQTFLEHIEKVYQEVGKMVLVLDRASYHMSDDAMTFFKKRDIILVWYPVGHPYLNPVEEVWSVLKAAVNNSVRYADINTHLDAVCRFMSGHKFDYDFATFWRRRAPKGITRPFIRMEGELDPDIAGRRIATDPKKKKKKTKKKRA